MTQIYDRLSDEQKWQVGVYGATEADVLDTIESYRARKRDREIVLDMINHGWVAANSGDTHEARQTLNRVKLTIDRFYRGEDQDFFERPAGQAYSILSDAQELLDMEDIRRAQMCMDRAGELVLEHEGVL